MAPSTVLCGLLQRVARRLSRAHRHWSTARDREFHDSLFASQTYDPFSPSYPGYLTIRRFADLADQRVRTGEDVIDLGCGPGEITCELARRRPDSTFLGVDHSAAAIALARRHADTLNLGNVRFELQDLERYVPANRVGLVTMFDAFHHILNPSGFIERIGQFSNRFFLIEPAGDRMGRWQRTMDLDWLAEALLTMRDRLEYQFGVLPITPDSPPPAPPAGEPTEHRYSIDDFSCLFAGFGLDMVGTIAGLERYGSLPHAISPIRDDVGRNMYDLVVGLEATLRRADLDLAAKHWAIYAERHGSFPSRRVPSPLTEAVERPVAGPYDAEYSAFRGPREAPAGGAIEATVTIANRSWMVWDSQAEQGPVFLSYHWLNAKGIVVVGDGQRSPLPRPIAPGESCTAAFRVLAPNETGRYTLAIDLVRERVTWFSQAGVPALQISIRVV